MLATAKFDIVRIFWPKSQTERKSWPSKRPPRRNKRSFTLPIPHFQQSLGIKRSEAQVRKVLGAEEGGTPTFAIQRLANAKLEVIYREWSITELLSALTAGQPVIVFVRTGFLGYYTEGFAHALVVVGADPEQQFWIHDPGQPSGPIIVSWNGLLAAWAEFGYRGVALLPKK